MSSFIQSESELNESELNKSPAPFILTDENDEIIFGVGNFTPQEDYDLEEQPLNMTWVIGYNKDTISRAYSFFLFYPKYDIVYAIIPGGEENFINFYTIEGKNKLKDRIRNILLKKTKFGISNGHDNQDPFIVVNDNPRAPYRYKHAWHKDSINVIPIPQITSSTLEMPKKIKITPSNLKLSDYTIIETTEDKCVSTTILNSYNPNDIFRFYACRGTAVCINNKIQQHSTPCILGYQCHVDEVDRTIGDEILKEKSKEEKKRNLFRTQFILQNEENREVFENFFIGIEFKKVNFKIFFISELIPEDISSFDKIDIDTYLSLNAKRPEIGGKRNKRRKTLKKKKNNKKRKTYNKK